MPQPHNEHIDADASLPRSLGRYWLLRLIARGGMGEVYLGSTTGLEGAEKPVVVKVIRREHAGDASFLARFLDEARVQAQLQHTGVVQVIDAARDDESGEPYTVFEYVEGRSLADVRGRLKQLGRRLEWPEAAALAALVAEALDHIHTRKDAADRPLAIVHRDLSPQNIMVSFDGEAKIIDFGTAKGENRRCHTVSGVVYAKPGYVAPEVAQGSSGDFRVDLYALGIMLWELCAGRRFLEGDSQGHMALVAAGALAPSSLHALVDAPVALDDIVARLTAHDPLSRYASAGEAARALASILSTLPVADGAGRSIRLRIRHLMSGLFPSEPGRSRREFARLAHTARATVSLPNPPEAAGASPVVDGLLAGTRYRVWRTLGSGASSTIYEGEHVDLGRKVALKVSVPSGPGAERQSQRFKREARALSRLSNECFPHLFEFGMTTDGRQFFVLERLEGETLETLLEREGPLPAQEVVRLGERILAAIKLAHDQGVVHRDLKPANIFLTDSGRVVLLDFGLALTRDEDSISGEVGEGIAMIGTPEYMAPEQATGRDVDERADLYAIGGILYEMLTGQRPFSAPSAVLLLEAKKVSAPERPDARSPGARISRELSHVVMKALEAQPAMRFVSATEMLQSLQHAGSAPAQRRMVRRTLGYSALAAAMGFAVVLLGGSVFSPEGLASSTRSVLEGLSTGSLVAAPEPKVEAPLIVASPGVPVAVEPAEEVVTTDDFRVELGPVLPPVGDPYSEATDEDVLADMRVRGSTQRPVGTRARVMKTAAAGLEPSSKRSKALRGGRKTVASAASKGTGKSKAQVALQKATKRPSKK